MQKTNIRPLVLIESPYHHPKEWGQQLNAAYLEACLIDSINRGECPIATHKLYTRCLDDFDPGERQLGMEMFHTIALDTEYHVVYYDLGISTGMAWGIVEAEKLGKRIVPRSIYGHPPPPIFQKLTEERITHG